MKKTLLIAGLALTIPFVAEAARQAVTQITGTQSSIGALKSQVNTRLDATDDNFVEVYANKAEASCFASEAAFNACFDLTWAAGGSMSWPASDGVYYAAKDGAWASLTGLYQAADADLTDLADGSLTGTKVGFADTDNLWTASNLQAALEEFNDSINAGAPNGTGAKVHWSQLLGVPAGFADGSDDGSGGGITHATSDGNYYASKDGAWASLTGLFQAADADLTDLADGSLTGTKVGFADTDNLWTASNVQAALEELNDSINAGAPNGTGAKVHWSQLLGVPAGFADGSDDGSGGGITHATSDGNYYASKDGAWASLTGLYQAADSDLTTWAGVTPGTGIATWLATPSGANLASALTSALPATKGGTGLTALGTGVATALGNNVNGTGGLATWDQIPAITWGTGLTDTANTISVTYPVTAEAFSGSGWNADTDGLTRNDAYDYLHTADTDDDGKVDVLDMGAGIPKTDANGAVSVATAGVDYDAPTPSTLTYTSDTSITAANLLANKFVSNYGASGEVDLVLPAVSYNITRTIIVEAAQIIEVCPPSGELFDFGGTNLDADDCIDSPSTAGSKAVFTRSRTGASTWRWSVDTVRGTWADTGASD